MKKITFLLAFFALVVSSSAQNLVLDFDGTSNQYIETAEMVPLTNSFTVMGWVYARAGHTQIFTWGSPTVNNYIQVKTNFDSTFQIYAPSGVINLTSTTSILNGWHHVAVTNNAGSVNIYVDGVNEGAATANFSSITPTKTSMGSALLNGSIQGTGNFQIDEFSVWNVALSGAEVSTYKNTPPAGTESGLVLAYNFNPEGAIPEGDNTAITSLNNLASNYNGALTGFNLNGASSYYVESTNEMLGVNGVKEKALLALYPNPTTDFVKINGLKTEHNFIIYNVLGLKVLSGTINKNTSVNVKSLNKGAYFFSINNGRLLKFIKN